MIVPRGRRPAGANSKRYRGAKKMMSMPIALIVAPSRSQSEADTSFDLARSAMTKNGTATSSTETRNTTSAMRERPYSRPLIRLPASHPPP
jgi:hypothetical protein